MGKVNNGGGVNPFDEQPGEDQKIAPDDKPTLAPQPAIDPMQETFSAAPKRSSSRPSQTIDDFIRACAQRWSQQDFEAFVEDGRKQLYQSTLSRPEATPLLANQFRALLKEKLDALMDAPELLTAEQLQAMANEALREHPEPDFVELFSRISATLRERANATAQEAQEAEAKANEGGVLPSSEGDDALPASGSTPIPDIANLPTQKQAEAVMELVTADSSRGKDGLLLHSVESLLHRLAQRNHLASLPEPQGKALFRELAEDTLNCRRATQRKIVSSLVDAFTALKQPSLGDFNILLEAIRWTPDNDAKSWFSQLDVDRAISSLPAPAQALASTSALTLRVSRSPAEFSQLSPAQARAIFDGLVDEAANHRRAEALPIIKALFDGFSRLQAPSLDDFEILLDAAAKIPTDGGDPPFLELRFSPAIAALPATQQAEAIARVLAQRASFGPTIFLRRSVADDLFQLTSKGHLATLPAEAAHEVVRALRNVSDKSAPGQHWQLNRKLANSVSDDESPPPGETPDSV